MADISQRIFSETFFLNEKFFILIKISLKFVPKYPLDNKPVMVQRIGDKPLSEPMLIRFTDAYMRHKGADELISPMASRQHLMGNDLDVLRCRQ